MSNQNLEVKVNAFLNAVQLLFHSNNKDQKNNANKFLVELEKNPDSWDIAYQVLLKDNLPEEVYFNALQILKNKIKYDFGNYVENPQYIEKLLNFFLTNLDKFKNSKHYLLINYCDCIGKAFLFTGNKFQDLLKQYIKKLYGDNSDINSLLSLLLIFNFINETGYDERMVIDKKSRAIFLENIKKICDDVFQFILVMINKLNEIKEDKALNKFLNNQILETIINYISFNFDEDIILKFNNDYMPIIDFIFQINEENLEKHSDCIYYLLQLPLNDNKMRTLAQNIFSKILNFKDIFYKSIETLDTEQSSFYVDVFTSMVQNNLNEILNEKRYDLIQLIVDLTKKCSPIKIGLIFEFFENLNQYLYDKNYSVEEVLNCFDNIFIQLIQNIIFLTKFEENIYKRLNESKTRVLENDEEYTSTKDYREQAKDFLEDFTLNYGFIFIFERILFPEFKNIISKIKENQENINLWNKLENILFIFSCISKEISPNSKSFNDVTILFYTIFEIPKEFIQIKRTITEIINTCPKIFASDKDLLYKGFNYIILGLDSNLTLKYCSKSAKKLLSHNKNIFSEKKIDLISLYINKLKDNIFVSENYLNILEGLIEVICYSKNNGNEKDDNELIKKSLVEIMKPWVFYLNGAKELIEKGNTLSDKDKEKFNNLLIIFKYGSQSAFESLSKSNKNIMYEIFSEIWPIINYIWNQMLTKSDIVENIIQLIKIYMRGLDNNFIKFIPEYLEIILKGYKLVPISSYLYGFEILVVAFEGVKDAQLKSLLDKTFNTLCQLTLNGYIKNEFDLNMIVEIGYDFYGMLFRILRKSPDIILDSTLFKDIINSGLSYFNASQIQEDKNVIIFFREILSYEEIHKFKELKKNNNVLYEKYKNIMQTQINDFGFTLCEKILKSFEETPNEGAIEEVENLLKDFIIFQKPLLIKGMKFHLINLSNEILTNKEKDEFLNLIDNFNLKEKEYDKFIKNLINRCISKQVRDRGRN